MRSLFFPLVIVVLGALLWWLFATEPEADVVLYCGVDQDQSQQIAQTYEKEAGLKLRYEGESEAFRSVGLPSRIKAEAARPKGDVFWSNEIMNMVDLGNQGLLGDLPPGAADAFPPMWRDPAGRYVAFGARARVFMVNTELLPNEEDHPRRLTDLLDPRYAELGLLTCMARPVTGTTYTHAVALLSRDEQEAQDFLKACAAAGQAGQMKITPSNGSAMRETRDPANRIAFCLTDTDDAWKAIREGAKVTVVYPDQDEGEFGTVLIPNTVAVLAGAPHPKAAADLLTWLISPENEMRLAKGPSAQIPLRPDLSRSTMPAHVLRPGTDFRPAEVDWQAVGANRDRWLDWLTATFRPAD